MSAVLDITEADFQRAVLELAKLGGWTVSHFRPARTARGWATPVSADGKGFPDCVLVHPTRCLVWFRELKREDGKLRPEQEAWRDVLLAGGADWALWRPSDLDLIAATLTGRQVRR